MRIHPYLLILPLATLAGAEPAPFVGRIVFEQKASGDPEGVKAFQLAASRVTAHIGARAYRQDEEGGLNAGSAIARVGARQAVRLDHAKKTSERGGAADLDRSAAEMRDFMPWHFKTDLEATGETATICGHETRRYRVKKSAFVRPDATAHVWVAPGLRFPQRRFQFEFEWNRVVPPLPLSIPTDSGAILKAEVLEGKTLVTITAVEIVAGEPDAALFAVPDGYEGPRLEAAPAQPQPAPRPAVDVAGLPAALTNSAGMKMVLVKPGTFRMGSPESEPDRHDDEKQHEVTLTRPYYVGVHEVTQKQWRAVMGTDSPSKFKGDDLPVENVTWHEAVAFCEALSKREGRTYRLPTEAEWEYAARAGETLDVAGMKLGERKKWLNTHAWQSWNAKYRTHPVGTLLPNAWGLFDTIGNVEEWTADGYGAYPDGPVTDPAGADSDRKVIRGQGWVSSYDFCRVAARSPRRADEPKSTIGFRVVAEPEE